MEEEPQPRRPPLPRPPLPPLRHQLRSLLLLGLVAVAVTAVAAVVLPRVRTTQLLEVSTRAPAIDLAGPGPVHADVVAAASGHPLVVEFFESSCPVCQQSAPDLCTLLDHHADAEVVLVDAAIEGGDAVAGFRHDRLARCAQSPRLQAYADPCRSRTGCGNVSDRWQVRVVPTVYIVDASGRIAYAATGGDAAGGADDALNRLARG